MQRLVVEDHGYPARAIHQLGDSWPNGFSKRRFTPTPQTTNQNSIGGAEQGLFLALRQYSKAINDTLGTYAYASDDIAASTIDLHQKLQRDLQVAFLSRRSPNSTKP